jgi:catechol 2,3-dioxygenase-like lactoylglutathione lyase family enzyme
MKMVITFDSIVLIVSDLERSIEFYRDKLGMQLRYRDRGFVALEAGPVPLQVESLEKQLRRSAMKLFLQDDRLGIGWHSRVCG